jgi:hypothetical protein
LVKAKVIARRFLTNLASDVVDDKIWRVQVTAKQFYDDPATECIHGRIRNILMYVRASGVQTPYAQQRQDGRVRVVNLGPCPGPLDWPRRTIVYRMVVHAWGRTEPVDAVRVRDQHRAYASRVVWLDSCEASQALIFNLDRVGQRKDIPKVCALASLYEADVLIYNDQVQRGGRGSCCS